MQMKVRTRAIAVILISAIIAHLAFIYSYPYLIAISSHFATKSEVKVNEAYYQLPINASFKKVVMPSPDILYSACVFDISNSDLLIEAKVPNFTYWSASFYSLNTDNFFTINDRTVKENLSVVLTTKKSCNAEKCVFSPSTRGIVIFRIFIPDNSMLPELIEYQKTIKCTPLKAN
jgi:uncharacterized membrane protein